jgi:hypothetical protein
MKSSCARILHLRNVKFCTVGQSKKCFSQQRIRFFPQEDTSFLLLSASSEFKCRAEHADTCMTTAFCQNNESNSAVSHQLERENNLPF